MFPIRVHPFCVQRRGGRGWGRGEIGRGACWGRGEISVVAGSFKKKKNKNGGDVAACIKIPYLSDLPTSDLRIHRISPTCPIPPRPSCPAAAILTHTPHVLAQYLRR